jgi:hypothetical protein
MRTRIAVWWRRRAVGGMDAYLFPIPVDATRPPGLACPWPCAALAVKEAKVERGGDSGGVWWRVGLCDAGGASSCR